MLVSGFAERKSYEDPFDRSGGCWEFRYRSRRLRRRKVGWMVNIRGVGSVGGGKGSATSVTELLGILVKIYSTDLNEGKR